MKVDNFFETRQKVVDMTTSRKLRMGMVGGGPGAFIGPVHRIAAELDGKIELVAGAFSQSAERSRDAGESYRIDPARAYANYQDMIEAERRRPDAIDFVVIVTPNHLHLPIAAGGARSRVSRDERQAGDGNLRRGDRT